MEKSHTSDLIAHLKALEQKEADATRKNRRQEIIKLRVEIKKLEIKKTIPKINEAKIWFLDRQTHIQTNQKTEGTSKLTESEMKRGT